MRACIVHSSCPDAATAERIARALVEERLAACVQAVPGAASTYRWQGATQVDAEVLLAIKTVPSRLAALEARLSALHPYAVPEVLVTPVTGGSADYLDWLEQACGEAGRGSTATTGHDR